MQRSLFFPGGREGGGKLHAAGRYISKDLNSALNEHLKLCLLLTTY